MSIAGVDDADAVAAIRARYGGVPRLPRRLLERPALEAVLDDSAPLTIVHGVQGYGKTTLLSAWSRARLAAGMPTVWLAAHAGLNRWPAFRDAMQLAWDATIPYHRQLTTSGAADGHDPSADSGASSVVVVIDDLHEIDDEDVLDNLLELMHLNHGLRLVVSTRRRHRIEVLAAGDLEVNSIQAHELTLSVPEIVDLSRLMGRSLSTSDATRLRSAVGGWISAARIILETVRPNAPLPLTAVRDYLHEKVLPSVKDEEILRQLKWYSLAASVDTRMIRDLAGNADADRVLALLEAPGLLERRYHSDHIELRFPTLVKDILRLAFEQEEPDAAREAHRAFAGWFARGTSAPSYISAFEHAVHAQDWERAKRVWADHATLLSMSFPKRFRDALTLVPAEITADEPGMRVARSSIAVVADEIGNEADGMAAWLRAYGEASARAFAEARGTLSLRDLLHFSAGRLTGLRMAGRFGDAVAFAREVYARVDDRLAAGEYPGDRLCWFYLQVGLTHRIVGDEVHAVRAYKLAWEHGARSQVSVVEANAAASLALIYAYKSDRRRAETWLRRQGALDTRRQWSNHLVAIPGALAAALLRLDELDSNGCLAELAELDDSTAPLDAWQVIAYIHAQHALHFGDPETALVALEDAERAHQPQPAGQDNAFTILTRSKIDLLIAAGRRRRAEAILRDHPENPLISVPLARIHLLSGEYAAARSIVADNAWLSRRMPRDRIELMLIGAVAAFRGGDSAAAATGLRRAVEVSRSSGHLRGLATIRSDELDELLGVADLELTEAERSRLRYARTVYPDSLASVVLTERERVLLEAIGAGTPRQKIAEALFVSVNTVNTQMRGLYEKLGVRSREEALAAARRLDAL